jgi:hypothetical protein
MLWQIELLAGVNEFEATCYVGLDGVDVESRTTRAEVDVEIIELGREYRV